MTYVSLEVSVVASYGSREVRSPWHRHGAARQRSMVFSLFVDACKNTGDLLSESTHFVVRQNVPKPLRIVAIFTTAFSLTLTITTRAKRPKISAATAGSVFAVVGSFRCCAGCVHTDKRPSASRSSD